MTTMLDPMLNEFREEAAVTKRVLDRVPPDKLSWKPHARSMSLGQLAIHIATIPGRLCQLARQDGFDVSKGSFEPTPPKDVEEIQVAFQQSIREVEKSLQEMTEQEAKGQWRLMLKDKEISSKTRISVLRSIMLNHWYHHRGQLTVYLRLLDVPLPVIYGRTADENPFA